MENLIKQALLILKLYEKKTRKNATKKRYYAGCVKMAKFFKKCRFDFTFLLSQNANLTFTTLSRFSIFYCFVFYKENKIQIRHIIFHRNLPISVFMFIVGVRKCMCVYYITLNNS